MKHIAFVAIFLALFTVPAHTHACSCAPATETFVAHAIENAAVVAEVLVEDISGGLAKDLVTVDAIHVWKTDGEPIRQIRTPSSGAACGYPFVEGNKYLVFAYAHELSWFEWRPWQGRPLFTTLCSMNAVLPPQRERDRMVLETVRNAF